MRTGKRRSWLLVVVVILGIGVILVAAFIVWATWGNRGVTPLEQAEARALPTGWTETEVTEAGPRSAHPESAVQTSSRQASVPASDRVLTGVLAFRADGRSFGSESYEIRQSTDGALLLESHGVFEFRVLVATVRVPFTQTLRTDEGLRPVHYELHVEGVMGFGARDVQTEIGGGVVRSTVNDEARVSELASEHLFVLGTFSSYALLPLITADEERSAPASYELLVFGGPPHSSDVNDDHEILIEPAEKANIRAGSIVIEVDAYPVRSSYGDSVVLSRDGEFLALMSEDETGREEGLLVYRADYFPDGIELIR
ncbi:MAG: hypothetical protein JSW65_08175 [Candidatus Bipolaricaulota bacterium]|nr:MAG: hypothetical protein JSW65_08175 [Candidatus Bipolaricaulota bacterium]